MGPDQVELDVIDRMSGADPEMQLIKVLLRREPMPDACSPCPAFGFSGPPRDGIAIERIAPLQIITTIPSCGIEMLYFPIFLE